MGLIFDLLLLPITGPVRGLQGLLGAIRDEAEATQLNASRARAELSDLELRRDLGEISEEDYLEQEEILLNRLNATLAEEDERAYGEGPDVIDGEVVDDESEDGDSGYDEYVDGEHVEDDDVADPDEDDER